MSPRARLDFDGVNAAALAALPSLLARWLPKGRREGDEWVSRNPKRDDHTPGSFKVNLRTCRWGDFASGDKGGDPVSLYAYLNGKGQGDAQRELAAELGVEAEPNGHARKAKANGAARETETETEPKANGTAFEPLPAPDGKPPPDKHRDLGRVAGRWLYRAADGTPEGYAC